MREMWFLIDILCDDNSHLKIVEFTSEDGINKLERAKYCICKGNPIVKIMELTPQGEKKPRPDLAEKLISTFREKIKK